MATAMTTTTSSSGTAVSGMAMEAAYCRPRLQDWLSSRGATSTAAERNASCWDRILLLDGGVSTHLATKINPITDDDDDDDDENTGGAGGGACFAHKELWSSSLLLTEPGRRTVLQGHLDWLDSAGANLISTVTYQCHYHEKTWPRVVIRSESDMNELWKHGIQLAAQALEQHSSSSRVSSSSSSSGSGCKRPTFLVASSGCYGAALANGAEYTGDYGPNISTQDLMHFHRRKLQQIIITASASCSSCDEKDNGQCAVDCIAIETVPSLVELKALVQLLSEPETISLFQQHQVACWISLACGDGECLYDKTPLIQALQVLQALPIEILPAVGLNCCDYRHLSSLANILVAFIANEYYAQGQGGSSRALVLYPNSGEEWDAVAKVFKPKPQATTSTTTEETAAATTTTTTIESTFVDCLMQVIENVEATWREKMKSKTTTSTSLLQYPRIIVGGCCRTTPAEIAALRIAIDKHLESEKAKAQQQDAHYSARLGMVTK